MFRKPTLKTYQKKKVGTASSAFGPSFIAREDISDDTELQPQEFRAFKDSDKSLEYDPFDTTFDRLARDTKMPPVPQNPADNSFYDSSDLANSSSDDGEAETLPDPLPLINPRPAIVRRTYKRQKLSEGVATARTKQSFKRGRGVRRNDSSLDENTEPNSKRQNLGKRGRNKRDTKEARNSVTKKKRRVDEKPVVSTYGGGGDENLNKSPSLRRCRVTLTRVDVSLDKSTKARTSRNISAGSSNISEQFVDTGTDVAEIEDEFVENTTANPKDKITSELKNPTVLLTRLNVPQSRSSIASEIWLSSTPINQRTTRPKSLHHCSPIGRSNDRDATERGENDSYEVARLTTGRVTVKLKDQTPRISRKLPKRLSPNQLRERKSAGQNGPGPLSDSPDPEPSGLMFEDSATPRPGADSYASLVENASKNATEESSNRPFMGFSRGFAGSSHGDSRPALRVVLAPIGNLNDVTDASTASPFRGFKESTDSGSLNLALDASDKTGASSGEFSRSHKVAKNRTGSAEKSGKNRTASAEKRKKSQIGSAEKIAKNRQGSSDEGATVARRKSLKKDAKASRSSSQESANDAVRDSPTKSYRGARGSPVKSARERRKMLQDTVSGLHNIFQRSAKKRQERLSESAKKLRNDFHESAEDWQNVSKQSANVRQALTKRGANFRPGISRKNPKSRANVAKTKAKEIAKDWESGTEEAVKDSSTKLNSDDEWATISDSPGAVSLSSGHTKNETADVVVLESIVLVSSGDENTSGDDDNDGSTSSGRRKFVGDESSSFEVEDNTGIEAIDESRERGDNENASRDDSGEFAGVNETSSRRRFNGEESSSFEAEEISNIEATEEISNIVATEEISNIVANENISNIEAAEEISSIQATDESEFRADESSVVETPHDGKSREDQRRGFTQPVVLLTRLSVPVSRPRQATSYENSRANGASESTKSNRQNPLSFKSRGKDRKKSANVGEEHESRESEMEMEIPKAGEENGNTTELEESAIEEKSGRDSSGAGFQWSTTKVESANESFSTRIERTEVDVGGSGEESFETAEISAKTTPRVEEPAIRVSTKDSLDKNRRSTQPVVLLSRLHDPMRITDRRRKYRDWGLVAITENLREKNNTDIEEEPENLESSADAAKDGTKEEDDFAEQLIKEDIEKSSKIPQFSEVGNTDPPISLETADYPDTSGYEGHESVRDDKIVYLKPGKCWSRSLSLFRQVHSQNDIESLARGKGKKWRESVQSLLDMQSQGVIQSCVKKNEDYKASRSCYGARNSAAAWIPGNSQPDTSRAFGQTSVGSPGSRFVRRVSIRVVPDGKNNERYEDSPFLEAYGITTSQNRKTIGKRSTLIAPRKTLVYNVQLADVTFDNIPKSLNSVTSRDVVLAQCDQDSSLPFDECYPDSYLNQCRKIGEGVFGEVFLYEKGTVRNVIKIIPIEGELKVNGERQKKFDEILSEIVIAKELNNLRFADTSRTSSFVEVKNIRCVVGEYPQKLIDLWKTYDDEKNSENDCPDMFDASQLYIVLELGHGGQDLEAFVFQNSTEAHALFVQTALALAVAEESLEFEHRDLHWGNVLISRTEDSQIDYKLLNRDIRVASKGVRVSVIDFTLSRMSYQGCSIFNDLSLDDDLFAAQGEYQFEIYRLMRQKVGNNWQTFEPYTNVLWLHYTLDKMITAVRYRRVATKVHRAGLAKLTELKNEILGYKSAFDFVTNCDNVTRLQGSRSSVSTIVSGD